LYFSHLNIYTNEYSTVAIVTPISGETPTPTATVMPGAARVYLPVVVRN